LPEEHDYQTHTYEYFFKNKTKAQNNERILLVDDEPYNLIALRIILELADEHGIVGKLIDQVTNGL
jgi:hypothetical protein